MRRKKRAALLGVLLAMALAVSGCAQEAAPQEPESQPAGPVNDGREATVVIGELYVSDQRSAALREIADKYQADYPNTHLVLERFDRPEDLRAALASGEAQIADVTDRELAGLVRDGLLRDVAEPLAGWSEAATLIPIATRASNALNTAKTYLLPSDASQEVLFYRADWFSAYNEGRASSEMIYCRTWDQMVKASAALEDRGKLAFAGGEKLVDYFDAMIWSSLALGRSLDPGMAYFYPSDPVGTVFPQEKAAEGAEQFSRVMTEMALPQALSFSAQEALAAFQAGDACFLLADRSVMPTLAETMAPDTWAVMEFPRGLSGTAVFAPASFRGWGVSSLAEDWEIALHFLTFLTSADCNTHYAKVCGTLPVHSTAMVLEPSFLDGDLAVELAMVKRPDWYQYALEPTLYRAWDSYRDQANGWLRRFVAGELTQEELMGLLDRYWLDALAAEGPLWE